MAKEKYSGNAVSIRFGEAESNLRQMASAGYRSLNSQVLLLIESHPDYVKYIKSMGGSKNKKIN